MRRPGRPRRAQRRAQAASARLAREDHEQEKAGPVREAPQARDAHRGRRGGPSTRARVSTALLALVLGAGLAAATYAVATSRPAQWASDPQLLISPESGLDPAATTSFYEALSRGQITATAATIVEQRAVLEQALEGTGLDPEDVSVVVSVVPETTVIRVAVSAGDRSDAEDAAQALVEESVTQLERLIPSYEVTSLTTEVPTAAGTGPTTTEVWSAVAAVGVLSVVATYVALMALWRGRRRRAVSP